MTKHPSTATSNVVAFALVTSLFFLWAFLHNINPILIPHLKKACQLTDTQSALIDTAVYLGYFFIALPAGWFMHRYGYKKGILCGLVLYAIGAFLFVPAASARSYTFFSYCPFYHRKWRHLPGNRSKSIHHQTGGQKNFGTTPELCSII